MLTRQTITPQQISDARKQVLAGEAAWKHIASFAKVVIAKGKTWAEFSPASGSKEAILALALGRTGNLRAPALQLGDHLLIGYSDSMYEHFLK